MVAVPIARHLLRAKDLMDARYFERAAALLRTTDHKVADICMAVGLQSVGSFTSSFRRAYAQSPTAYRAQFPSPNTLARVPTCVLRAHGRPEHRTFGEDRTAGAD